MRQVREVVELGPRASNTPGAERAAEFLAERARQAGWDAHIDTWTEETGNGPMTFRNVRAVLPGEGPPFVLLGSHYDTKALPAVPDFRGANDSGSSTGLLLALMQHLASAPPRRTVECLFFDGEECLVQYAETDGLHGSKRYARLLERQDRLKHCRAMILMDMVGDRNLRVTFPRSSSPRLVSKAFAIAETQGTRDHFGYRVKGDILDDHVPFARRGVPTINFIDFDFGPDNSYWHTAEDTLDKLSPESLEIVGNAALALTYELAGE